MFEHHRVAGHECGHHAIHRDQIGIVPGCHREDHAERFAPHETPEVFLGGHGYIVEGLRRDGDHVTRTLEHAAHFVRRIPGRAAHLPGEFLGDFRTALFEFFAESSEDGRALGERGVAPFGERVPRAAQCFVDLLGGREHTLDVYPPIDGARGFLDAAVVHQMISKYRASSQSVTARLNSRSSHSRLAA
jgi:hypothetical protein